VRVCAGTRNPSKIRGIEKAFTAFFNEGVEIVFMDVGSEAPPQPIGFDEIIKGARSRALKALNSMKNCDFSVGVEAGIIKLKGIVMDIQIAVIMDKDEKESLGLSPSFPLPQKFSNPLINREVEELEILVDNYYGTKSIGDKGGFIKLLSKNVITREDLTKEAVIMALLPWINKHLYGY